jgi:hypothetical protein
VAWQHINFYGRYEFTKASESINMEEIVEALVQADRKVFRVEQQRLTQEQAER